MQTSRLPAKKPAKLSIHHTTKEVKSKSKYTQLKLAPVPPSNDLDSNSRSMNSNSNPSKSSKPIPKSTNISNSTLAYAPTLPNRTHFPPDSPENNQSTVSRVRLNHRVNQPTEDASNSNRILNTECRNKGIRTMTNITLSDWFGADYTF